ncbi:LOG family protein [Yunchengibacter salinarum]|uniref:LOG family protein n=1 Tax=Yunchengibacter salinarum TaxID=3133399 RepID=UPI0035B5F635
MQDNASRPIRSVCVYCGSRMGNHPAYKDMAETIGQGLAKRGHTLVYGAGSIGLMGVVARAARDAGGEVVGIIPRHLDDVEIVQDGLSETHITENMHERKKMMFDRSDAFIVLPGGFGTLDETLEVMTWVQLGLHDKPIILINHENYWTPLLELVNHVLEAGFADEKHRGILQVAASAEEALGLLGHTSRSTRPSESALF